MKSALFHFFSFILILKIRQSTKIFLCARQNFEKLIISQSTTQGSRTRARSRKRVTRSLENSLQFRNGRDKGWHDVSQHFFGRKIFFLQLFCIIFPFFLFLFFIIIDFLTFVTLQSRRPTQAVESGHSCSVVS